MKTWKWLSEKPQLERKSTDELIALALRCVHFLVEKAVECQRKCEAFRSLSKTAETPLLNEWGELIDQICLVGETHVELVHLIRVWSKRLPLERGEGDQGGVPARKVQFQVAEPADGVSALDSLCELSTECVQVLTEYRDLTLRMLEVTKVYSRDPNDIRNQWYSFHHFVAGEAIDRVVDILLHVDCPEGGHDCLVNHLEQMGQLSLEGAPRVEVDDPQRVVSANQVPRQMATREGVE